MFNVSIRSNEELKFIANDCYEAVSAYPQGNKAIEYIKTAHKCEKELNRRESLQAFRKTLKTYLCIGDRWITDYQRKVFNRACFVIGIRKLKS